MHTWYKNGWRGWQRCVQHNKEAINANTLGISFARYMPRGIYMNDAWNSNETWCSSMICNDVCLYKPEQSLSQEKKHTIFMITPMPVCCWSWLVVWLILYILKRLQAAASTNIYLAVISNTDIVVYDFVYRYSWLCLLMCWLPIYHRNTNYDLTDCIWQLALLNFCLNRPFG